MYLQGPMLNFDTYKHINWTFLMKDAKEVRSCEMWLFFWPRLETGTLREPETRALCWTVHFVQDMLDNHQGKMNKSVWFYKKCPLNSFFRSLRFVGMFLCGLCMTHTKRHRTDRISPGILVLFLTLLCDSKCMTHP